MKKNWIKKAGVVLTAVLMSTGLLACNTKIKVQYDYNAEEFFTLGEYKELEISLDAEAIAKKIVDDRVQSDLDAHTTYSEVARAAQEEDQVTVDFTGSIGGSMIEGFSSEDYSLILGQDSFLIDGFVDELYGMKKNDTKIVTLTVPESFTQEPEYAGKRIVYEITMKTVEQPLIPMITDAYVKENFMCETVGEYREKLRNELQSTIDSQVYSQKRELVLDKLNGNCIVKGYPEEFLNSRRTELEESIQYYALMQNLTNDAYCRKMFGVDFEEYVKRSVAQDAVMQLIIKKEDLSITEYEYKDNLASFSMSMGYSDKDSFEEKFGKAYIAKNMLYQKAENLVVDSAVIK